MKCCACDSIGARVASHVSRVGHQSSRAVLPTMRPSGSFALGNLE